MHPTDVVYRPWIEFSAPQLDSIEAWLRLFETLDAASTNFCLSLPSGPEPPVETEFRLWTEEPVLSAAVDDLVASMRSISEAGIEAYASVPQPRLNWSDN